MEIWGYTKRTLADSDIYGMDTGSPGRLGRTQAASDIWDGHLLQIDGIFVTL